MRLVIFSQVSAKCPEKATLKFLLHIFVQMATALANLVSYQDQIIHMWAITLRERPSISPRADGQTVVKKSGKWNAQNNLTRYVTQW